MASGRKYKLVCETKFETFADYTAIVGEGACDADIAGKSNRYHLAIFFIPPACDAILYIIALTVRIDRSARN